MFKQVEPAMIYSDEVEPRLNKGPSIFIITFYQ